MKIRFSLNGKETEVDVPPDRRALEVLREDCGLQGAREGCGAGECGACTVLVDGENRLSCLMLAAQLQGRRIETIEGLAEGDELHPLQASFISAGAVQCGFCSPGAILSAAVLLRDRPAPDREEIRTALSGNLCRCTGYVKMIDAVRQAARTMGGEDAS